MAQAGLKKLESYFREQFVDSGIMEIPEGMSLNKFYSDVVAFYNKHNRFSSKYAAEEVANIEEADYQKECNIAAKNLYLDIVYDIFSIGIDIRRLSVGAQVSRLNANMAKVGKSRGKNEEDPRDLNFEKFDFANPENIKSILTSQQLLGISDRDNAFEKFREWYKKKTTSKERLEQISREILEKQMEEIQERKERVKKQKEKEDIAIEEIKEKRNKYIDVEPPRNLNPDDITDLSFDPDAEDGTNYLAYVNNMKEDVMERYQVYKKQKYPVVDKDVQLMYALLDVLYFYQDVIGEYPEYGEDFYYNPDTQQYMFDQDTERGKRFANLFDNVLRTDFVNTDFINVALGNLVEQNWVRFTETCLPNLENEVYKYINKTAKKRYCNIFRAA